MLPWSRSIYDTKLGGWPEKAGNPSPHPSPRIPAPTWGPNFNTPLLPAFSGPIQINMKLYTYHPNTHIILISPTRYPGVRIYQHIILVSHARYPNEYPTYHSGVLCSLF